MGVQPGRRVLDAGCGSGSFLPLLSELVGPGGRVSALDLAPEHVAMAATVAWSLPDTPVDVRVGSLLQLPYPDGSFDAVWCANTVQYLTDDELGRALGELWRVVRPGGLVAVKELDVALISVRPGDRFRFADLFRTAGASPGYAQQLLRSADLYRWLTAAGLRDVRQETTLIERFAPLSPQARAFYVPACAELARMAGQFGVAGDWDGFLDTSGAAGPLDDGHGYISEGSVLAVGVVKE